MGQTKNSIGEMNIAIVGLGLMGGSLAIALNNKCNSIYGVDNDKSIVSFALDNGLVDKASTNIEEILPQADLIILATPIKTIIELLQNVHNVCKDGAIVFDLGSTKEIIVSAMNSFPPSFEAIGGHPICGKEKSSIYNANPEIYSEALFVTVPTKRTTARSIKVIEEMIQIIGSKIYWLDAVTHDKWIAVTSHLPYILSVLISSSIRGDEIALTGPGLKSMVRLAGSDIQMASDILLTNRENIVERIDDLLESLFEMRKIIAADERVNLLKRLNEGHNNYKKII
jgi:prephenate dehydrogenase